MDATILVNRTHRLPRKAIPQTLVEPEIIFDAPVGDRKRLLAVSAAKGVEALFARGKEEGIYLCGLIPLLVSSVCFPSYNSCVFRSKSRSITRDCA